MKKFLAMILCAIMLLPTIPITVGAETLDSGTCGDNLTWTFDSSGTLTISGTGEMEYYLMVYPPWREHFSEITTLVIEEGVKRIGEGAFKECNKLVNITIPDSVTSIGEYAFGGDGYTMSAYYSDESNWENGVLYIDNCLIASKSDITECKIKDSCKVIADMAFDRRKELAQVTIPEGVRNIGQQAFYECENLNNINIPNTVESVDFYAFKDTGYYKNEANWQGDLIYINHCLIGAKDVATKCNIKDGCKIISGGVFKECDFTDITIPDSITYIGSYAFSGCRNLTSIAIPDGITEIKEETFDYCTNLKSVSIPDSVTSIGSRAFDCSGLVDITLPKYVTEIGDGAFSFCRKLKNIVIPDSVIKIDYSAFSGCTGLENIAISKSVAYISIGAFDECGNLNINVSPYNPYYSDIDGVLFNKEKTEIITYAKDKIQPEYSIPSGVKNIGDKAFYWCSSLTSVTIPDSVKSIGDRAFYWCSSLTDVYYAGSEEQWENITIEGDNHSLRTEIIHYNSDVYPRIEVSEPVVEGGSITITAERKNIGGEGELFAVGYDGNKLTASEKLQGGAATLPAEDVKTIKVFCWDSLDTMRPLCEPKTITIK